MVLPSQEKWMANNGERFHPHGNNGCPITENGFTIMGMLNGQ